MYPQPTDQESRGERYLNRVTINTQMTMRVEIGEEKELKKGKRERRGGRKEEVGKIEGKKKGGWGKKEM